MKTKLLFWLAFFSIGMQAQNINFLDANFKAMLLSSSPNNEIAKNLSGNYFAIDANADGEIQLSEAEQVGSLYIGYNNYVTNFQDVLNFISINELIIRYYGGVEGNPATSISIQNLTKLKYFRCISSHFNSIIIKDCQSLQELEFYGNSNLVTLNINNLPGLKSFVCESNSNMGDFKLNDCPLVENIDFKFNGSKNIDFSNLSNLKKLDCTSLIKETLNVSNCINLEELYCDDGALRSLNVQGCNSLRILDCKWNFLTALDLQHCKNLSYLDCSHNNLSTLFIKNGSHENVNFSWGNENLQYICADESQVEEIRNLITQHGLANCTVDSNCGTSDAIVYIPDANFKEALLGTNSNNYVICYDYNNTNFLLDQNQDGEIQLSEASLVKRMVFFQRSNYTTLEGINSFTNLETIQYENDGSSSHIHGKIGNINLDGLNNFKTFNLSGCDVGKISIKNCPNVLEVKSAYTDTYNTPGFYDLHGNTEELIIENCPSLNQIVWTNNNLESATVSNCSNLKDLVFRGNSLTTFDASQLTNLEYLDLSNNQQTWETIPGEANFDPSLSSLNINGLSKLISLNISNQLLASLDLQEIPILEKLDCGNNKITALDVALVPNLVYLNARQNLLTNQTIDFTKLNYNNLYLNLSNNLLSGQIILNTSIDLFYLDFSHNAITDFIVNGYIKESGTGYDMPYVYPYTLNLSYNQLANLKISEEGKMTLLSVSSNPITSIDLPNIYSMMTYADNTNLNYLGLKGTHGLFLEGITSENFKISMTNNKFNGNGDGIQISNSPNLKEIDVSESALPLSFVKNNPNLEIIKAKNGIDDFSYMKDFLETFDNNNSLKYICVDDSELIDAKNILNNFGYTNVNINSYCSFTPGGSYNTVSGTVKIDADNNGCDASDDPFEFLKLKISDGTTSGETFVQQNGKYEFYTQAGNFNITALAENPSLFNISPSNFSATFADPNNNVFTQDICVTANGTQNDAEVVIAPLTAARPGFDATYKLVWRNKGNKILSGKVVLNYDHNRMAFQSSSLAYSVISNGSIEFNYSDLKPFANGSTELVFTINTPTDPVNPVNSDDILPFNAQITPNMSDLTPEDNNFKFDQKVVNSFDPNDIVCMEGEVIPTVAVGKYMHYVVNFENTGTAEAENIVVKMDIDPAEFDINTLQLQNASADVSTVIAGNTVEFKFKKIKLKAGGHGHVLLKMRSLTGLQEGDTVNNKADIYFDYNFPVTTNDYVTTILDEHSVLNAKVNYEAAAFSSNNYTIDFDASLSTGNIASYAWEFPNAASVSSTSAIKPVVTYNVAGNYTAKLTVSDADNNTSVKTVSFKVGNTTADLSTGRDNDGNFLAIDADDDDWKGYDINGTEITPKVRTTYTGWGNADIANGNNSRWVSLNNFEGYYNYKSRAFTIPNNATDAKLNLRSLSFVRNWTYLVKINPDGSETETEITKTQWLSDGFKGWLNSRSPKVDNYALSPGTYYIKVLVYSNNSTVRESLDVNAIVTSSTGLMNANKIVPPTITLQAQNITKNKVKIYPVPTHGELNIDSDSEILSVEVHDAVGRILEKKHFAPSKSVKLTVNGGKGLYFLRIMTKQGIVNQKIIKE